MIADYNIIVFGDDWGRHPSSSQHLVRALSRDNHVLWVNSIGMRSPSFSASDLKRVTERLKGLFKPRKEPLKADNGSTNVTAIHPLFIPFHDLSSVKRLNFMTIKRQIHFHLRKHHRLNHKSVMWISNPQAAYLRDTIRDKFLIYYCGDEFTAFKDINKEEIVRLENELLEAADLCIFSSQRLVEQKGDRVRGQQMLLPHGVDIERFKVTSSEVPEPMRSLKSPLIGYFGIFTDWIDLDLLEKVTKLAPDLNFCLMGNANDHARDIGKLPNVTLLGMIPYQELANYVNCLDVALLLYKDNEMTRAINPLKMLECYALGKPVVSTTCPPGVPGNEELYVANQPGEYVAKIREALACGEEKRNRLKEIVKQNTWAVRDQTLRNALNKLL